MISKQTFDHYLNNKCIAVVGNSRGILKYNNGPLIDAHDVVIRFSAGWPDQHPASTGLRTDIWSCAVGNKDIKHRGHRLMKERHFSVWSWPNTHGLSPELRPNTFHFPRNIFDQLKSKMGTVPTNGALMLYYLITQANYHMLTVFGVDFYRHPAIYTGPNGPCGARVYSHHDIVREKAFMKPFLINARDLTWIV